TIDAAAVSVMQLQAYRAIRELSIKMARAIQHERPRLKTVLFYNANDLTSLANYATVKKELSLLGEGYSDALASDTSKTTAAEGVAKSAAFTPILLGPAVVGAAFKSVIDLIALFRTNVDIKGATVTFDDASLAAEVSKALRAAYDAKTKHERGGAGDAQENERGRGLDVIYSALASPGMIGAAADEDSELLKSFDAVGRQRQEAELRLAAFDALDATAKADSPARENIASLKALNARFDLLLAGTGQTGDPANVSPLSNVPALTGLLKAERLAVRMRPGASAILFVKAAGGGESKTTQNLWRGSRIFQSGTAVLSYLLFSDAGELILSDVLFETTSFIEVG
ncbi:MAG: hypothetical protein M3348_13025, partial [Acidobacteriota bacterium]|nr:hypothetical protein [Acidobacteriota bacterium]